MTTIKDASPEPNSKSQTSSSQSTTPSDLPESTDVLIVGAGPVGLLIAYQLSKFGCHNYVIIGKYLASSSSQIHILYTLSA
jgi:pyruvate/2-oxoglutarate dehydrogenase complex dihydrolipoamide dehydrogenase (E3) component